MDWDYLNIYSDGDAEFEQEILQLFLQQTRLLLQALHKAHAQHNFRVLVDVAHQMKGMCGSIGAYELQEIAFFLEKAANGQEPQAVEQEIVKLEEQFNRVLTEIRQRGFCL